MQYLFLFFLTTVFLNPFQLNAQWQYSGGPSDKAVMSMARSGNNLFAGTDVNSNSQGPGSLVYFFNGNTWADMSFPVGNNKLTSITVDGSNVFAGLVNGGGVYFSADNGASWTSRSQGFPAGINIHTLAIHESRLFAGTDKGLYYSDNDGVNWYLLGLGNLGVLSLAFHDDNIVAGTNGNGIHLSTSNGNMWMQTNTLETMYLIVNSLLITNSHVYAGTNESVFRVSSSGGQWVKFGTGSATWVEDMVIHDGYIIKGTKTGVYKAKDVTDAWSKTSAGLPVQHVTSLAKINNMVYAGTNGEGVWRRSADEIIVGIEDPRNSHSRMIVYPNPNNGKFRLQLPEDVPGNTEIRIFNLLGQAIYSLHTLPGQKTMDIDITGHPGEFFILEVDNSHRVVSVIR